MLARRSVFVCVYVYEKKIVFERQTTMKLLGRRNNRGFKGKDKSNFSPSKVSKNVTSPEKRTSSNRNRPQQQQRYPSSTGSPINLALQQNLPNQYQKKQSGRPNSKNTIVFTTSGNENDENSTFSGNQSLYNWSLSDNVPSVGSAAHLFDDEESIRFGGKKKKAQRRNWLQGVGNRLERNKTAGDVSSSDDEDDDFDDSFDKEEQDFTQNRNFQYSMLSDSPPPKSLGSNGSKTDDDHTPNRNETNRGGTARTMLHSEKVQNIAAPYPIQKANKERMEHISIADSSSTPVDVDEFIGIVTPRCNEERKPKSLNLNVGHKTTIHNNPSSLAGANLERKVMTNENSDSLPATVKASILRSVSLEESVNADAAFNELYDSDGASLQDAQYASMRNLVDSSSPYAKRRSKPSRDFSSPGSQSGVIEKSFEGSINDNFKKKDWPLKQVNSNERDLLWTKRQNELNHIKSEIENDALSPRREKSKKNAIKNRMKKKLHSLVAGTKPKSSEPTKKRNDNVDLSRSLSEFSMKPLTGIEKYGNHVKKANLARSTSDFSMEPLTGIEEGFVKRNARSRKEIMVEMQRRKDVERRIVEKKQIERKLRYQQTNTMRVGSGYVEPTIPEAFETLNESTSEDATCLDLDRNMKKDSLQQWVTGFSNLSFDDDRPRTCSTQSNINDSIEFGTNSSNISGALTARIDNTSAQCRWTNARSTDVLNENVSNSFETEFPCDDSKHFSFPSSPDRLFLHL